MTSLTLWDSIKDWLWSAAVAIIPKNYANKIALNRLGEVSEEMGFEYITDIVEVKILERML